MGVCRYPHAENAGRGDAGEDRSEPCGGDRGRSRCARKHERDSITRPRSFRSESYRGGKASELQGGEQLPFEGRACKSRIGRVERRLGGGALNR